MCRFAAYLGPAITLADAFYAPAYGLDEQARRPRHTPDGTIDADGSGVVWWRPDEAAPLRYATASPPWADRNLRALAPRLEANSLLAAVCSARPGVAVSQATVLPYELDGVACAHDGFLSRFKEVTAARCLAKLPEELVGEFEGLSDSRAVFLLAIAALREDPDLALSGALVGAVGTAARICSDAGAECSLNVVLATADEIVGVRTARGVEASSLHLRNAIEEDGGSWLASEPLDDTEDWTSIAADHLVRITPTEATVTPIGIDR
jgi:glutamine amidotransferase